MLRNRMVFVRRPILAEFDGGRKLVTVPDGILIETTGRMVRADAPNGMAEIVWDEERYAVFIVDLQDRTSAPDGKVQKNGICDKRWRFQFRSKVDALLPSPDLNPDDNLNESHH